jgi:hypothetical protein
MGNSIGVQCVGILCASKGSMDYKMMVGRSLSGCYDHRFFNDGTVRVLSSPLHITLYNMSSTKPKVLFVLSSHENGWYLVGLYLASCDIAVY